MDRPKRRPLVNDTITLQLLQRVKMTPFQSLIFRRVTQEKTQKLLFSRGKPKFLFDKLITIVYTT